ncbi:hypothetical protein CCACVL1_01803, partial [Corchorus capsularis]
MVASGRFFSSLLVLAILLLFS